MEQCEQRLSPLQRAIVVIPTYNERENITALISAIHQVMPAIDILVVDDNSPDGTAALVRSRMAEDPQLALLERPGKMGLGTAYCDGFRWALERGYDIICQMDADFSHNPEDLPRLIAALDHADVVIGSRYVSGVNVVNWPMRRLLLSYMANLYTRIVTGMPIKDATGGFKAFRAEILRKIDLGAIHSNGYAFQIEMNFRAWRLGARIEELSIVFVDRTNGVSKMSRTIIYEAAWIVWKLKLLALIGKL
ncbi:MAG: polyprenol monophosphomannose synthase [Bacteroidota bacterium]|nr:polyprenol monophosphomannose synthase [Candidatus Kapabacteria bacterium]MCS7301843.1 polyprenol monophosphomannose synthase [Candidatus Kapabacteria bacterium]MCX7936096.1 polyprenol monophosphomannose synthase [Chlorobiota bacterium]MDW8075010.1 polyprenol monophosphomannose synthase [Bacteroidota bacterium]MDW8271649.1 polyprenol monophosphomannose synthase [Bacteroidota bacterium]